MANKGGGAIEMSSNNKRAANADDLFDDIQVGEDDGNSAQKKKVIPKGVPKRSETQ
jgi:uncharacterized membrane-anchored protein